MDFFPHILTQYIEQHSSAEDPILAALNRETHLKHLLPQMVSGHQQGLFLELASSMLRPKTILEIGTFTGYSAICLAKGLAPGGKLHTIDINNELEPITSKYYALSGMADHIEQYFGAAADIIPGLAGTFDLVFIDADKSGYAAYYDLVIDRVKPDGIIITDNVLWSGKVVEPVKANDEDTLLIQAFNKKIASDPRVEVVLLPIRDGISIARKK
jgi:caffeoyl-CoA O-methyltransferase